MYQNLLIASALFCAKANADWVFQSKPKTIRVAIIDTGLDATHKIFQGRLWVNPYEIPNNKMDDDHNGYVDDVHGYNFANQNVDITDHHGHGTHIAGIIAQNTGPKIELMILKYYDSKARWSASIDSTTEAMKYAVQMGAHVINYSAGGPSSNPAEREVIKKMLEKQILLVAAAGNWGQNSDLHPYYPAAYEYEHILSVASLNLQHQRLPSSNFGRQSVDIGALGLEVLSTLPRNQKGTMTGTSQATAFVSAAISTALSSRTDLNNIEQIRLQILNTTDSNSDLPVLNRERIERSRHFSFSLQSTALFSSIPSEALESHDKVLAKPRNSDASLWVE